MEAIRRQLVVPPYVSAIYTVIGLGMIAAGIALVVASSGAPVAMAPAVALAEIESPAHAPEPRAAVAASEQAAPAADEIKLVFRAGGASYLRLADLERDDAGARRWPRHGAPRLVNEDDAEVAIAAVRDADVPAMHRAWAGKQVIVDGTCRATVTGFAVVSRLYGDTAYAGLEQAQWDAASVMQRGAPVLAARLDRLDLLDLLDLCAGGTFARDAALPPVVLPEPILPEPIRDERLAGAARSALIASSVGAEATQRWDELGPADAEEGWWEHAGFSTKVLRHPRTGATLVTVHAHADHGCGGPDINLWGVYRVAADGTLSPVHEAQLGDLHSIERIIDVEGDGELELIGRSWLGADVVLAGADGSELDRLAISFYGCPC